MVAGGLVAKSCPSAVTPWTVSPLGRPQRTARFLCPWDFAGKNTELGCYSLFQEIFPTQGSNMVSCIAYSLLYCRQTFYQLSHQGSAYAHLINYFLLRKKKKDRSPKENKY